MSYHAPDPRYSDPSVNRANAIALPIFAVIGSIFVIFPFRAFYLLRNFPACSMCITLWIINLGTFLNAIIWSTDDWTTWWPGYGLCDVESVLRWPITLSASTGLCCFLRGLANALNTDGAIMNPTKAQRRRQLIGEILIIWGPPALVACLRYIIQAGRYAIVPVFGCTGEDDNSWPYVVVVVIWGPVFTTIASGYSIILLHRLRKHRKTIASALTTTGSGMVPRKFIKLAIIALAILIIYLPVQILFIFRALPRYWVPYDWNRIHNSAYWGTISYYHTQDVPLLQYSGWATISYGFVLLPFYGFNDEAISAYRRWLVVIGFGKCFPSLKEPYRSRGRGELFTGSQSQSRSSEPSGRFDLVAKAMSYFDTETPLYSLSRSRSRSRKGSQIQSLGSIGDNSTIGKGTMYASSTVPITSSASDSALQIPAPTTKRNRFATIRNWGPLMHFFSNTSKENKCQTAIQEKYSSTRTPETSKDLEAHKVSTTIWSSATDNNSFDLEIESAPDPLSPVLGSRAYRERERREMERDKKERKDYKASDEADLGNGRFGSGVVIQKTFKFKSESSGVEEI